MIELGSQIRDRVSGMVGIATARLVCLNGCVQYSLKPPISKKDPEKMPDAQWIDEEQLEVVGTGVRTQSKPSGGGVREHP